MLTAPPPPSPGAKQSGVALLEALVAILIFSIGLLGLVSLQARAIATTSDAKYRSDAAFLANKIIGVMWGDKANLPTYSSGGGAGNICDAGAISANPNVIAWLNEVSAALPGAATNRQRIVVDAASGQVSIAICWLTSPNATSYHKHEVSARIQDNS